MGKLNASPLSQQTGEVIKINFPDAIRAIIAGKKITKVEWNDKDIYGFLNGQFLSLHKKDGKNYQWIVSDGDLLGIDYIIL